MWFFREKRLGNQEKRKACNNAQVHKKWTRELKKWKAILRSYNLDFEKGKTVRVPIKKSLSLNSGKR